MLPPATPNSPASSEAPWVWLGSGLAVADGAGNKASLLDRAAQAGLPVPRGIVLLDRAWQSARDSGAVVERDSGVAVADATRLVAQLRLPQFEAELAVRSAFSAEDGDRQSLAGHFRSHLGVPARSPAALADALASVWASAGRHDGALRRDTLLMEMVPAQWAGVAFTERDHEDDLVNYTIGTAERLVAGDEAGSSLALPKLRAWEQPDRAGASPGWSRRLQALLRDVRGVFGSRDWDLEWADDGERCWLVQLRPVTRPTVRDETFTIANHKEILPELPSRFMASLIESCAAGLFNYYRRFDAELPRRRPFIEVLLGRPHINLSLLQAMLRIWGLPTRLVTASIGGAVGPEYPANAGRLARKLPVLARLGLAQLGAVRSARHTRRLMLRRTAQAAPTISAEIETLRWLYTALVREMFSLTAAISGPVALLRRLGVLPEHAARHQTVATRLYDDLAPLRALAAVDPDVRRRVAEGRVPADAAFIAAWTRFLQQHGHRGIYESDIARPRYHEAPEPLLRSLAQPVANPSPPPPRTLLGRLTSPLWRQAGAAIRAREELRYTAMLGFDRVRRRLLTLADRAVAAGRLPDRDALWLLSVREAGQLDCGWQADAAWFEARRAEIGDLGAYRLPDLIRRSDDLERYRTDHSTKDSSDAELTLRGVSLTPGDIDAVAWVAMEPDEPLPDGFTGATTILVARAIDASWISTFAQVAGVIVETGGDLSHGSIILREIGLPAVTNVPDATQRLATGQRVRLRAASGLVHRQR